MRKYLLDALAALRALFKTQIAAKRRKADAETSWA